MSRYRNNISIFTLAITAFFSLHKMVNTKNNPNNYKTVKISIAAITKNLEMLKVVPDNLKTKTMCKNKNLPLITMYNKVICNKVE